MKKSQGIQFVLTFLFGPLGLLYSNIRMAIFLTLFGLILIVGGGWKGAAILWVVAIAYGINGVKKYNADQEGQIKMRYFGKR